MMDSESDRWEEAYNDSLGVDPSLIVDRAKAERVRRGLARLRRGRNRPRRCKAILRLLFRACARNVRRMLFCRGAL